MRRPAKLIATTLVLLAGGAAAAPGNHGGLHEWLGIVAKRDGSFHELAGESISRWEFLIRGATAGGTTAATAVSRRAVKIFIDTSRFMYPEGDEINDANDQLNRIKKIAIHLAGLKVRGVVFVWVVESTTKYYKNGRMYSVLEDHADSNKAIHGWLSRNKHKVEWAHEALNRDFFWPAEAVGGVLVATAAAAGTAAALYTHDFDALLAPIWLAPVVPKGWGEARRDTASHTCIYYRDKFLAIAAITGSILAVLFSLCEDCLLDQFARRIGKPRYTDGRVLDLLAGACGGVSRLMKWSTGILDSAATNFAKQFVSRIEERLSGKTGPGKAFRAPSGFSPTASRGNLKLAGSLKHVNAMVEVVVQAGRTDFNRLKRRVTHYTAIAEKQRTGI